VATHSTQKDPQQRRAQLAILRGSAMRTIAVLVAVAAAACTGNTEPAAVPSASAPNAAAVGSATVQTADGLLPAANRALAGDAAAAAALVATPAPAVPAIVAAAAGKDLAALGRAPTLLHQLGTAALPALCVELKHQDVVHRRIAVLALLQFGTEAAPVADALQAARSDADVSVSAGAELAWQKATGADVREREAAHLRQQAAQVPHQPNK
jgi:hypothetical protein